MLREELKDDDIPHWTKIRAQIQDCWDKYLSVLESRLNVSAVYCRYAT